MQGLPLSRKDVDMATSPEAPAPLHPVIWVEIPVTDLDAARRFYEAFFGWKTQAETDGPNTMAAFPSSDPRAGVAGHLYPGTPTRAGGPTVHLAVSGRLEDAIDRVREAGGAVLDMPPVTIPPGRFAYALDLDGNPIGLFEPAA